MKRAKVTVVLEKIEAEHDDLVNSRSEEEAKRVLTTNMFLILSEYGITEDSHVDIKVEIIEEEN